MSRLASWTAMARRLQNVQRVDHHYFHGWRVCITRQGQRYERYFRDSRDRGVALSSALRWRDHMLAILPPRRLFKRRYTKNTTGVVGVYRSRERTRRGTTFRRYGATWIDETGRRHKRSFSVAKYGAARARDLAVKARTKALEQLLRPAHEDPRRLGRGKRQRR